MHILRVNNITVNFAGRELYRDLSWVIGDKDRIALVGPHGAGKSTLFRALTGEVELERGHISRATGLRIGYLPQDINLPPAATLIQAAMIKPPELAEAEGALSAIESQLADPEVYGDEERLAQTLSRHESALTQYEGMNGGPPRQSCARVAGDAGFQRR